MSDILLGAVLGFVAGVASHAAFLRSFRFGWTLLGPYRAAEGAVAENQVALRTLGRGLLASAAGAAVCVAVILGLSLPARPFVDAWARFRLVWITAFAFGVLVAMIVGWRRAV